LQPPGSAAVVDVEQVEQRIDATCDANRGAALVRSVGVDDADQFEPDAGADAGGDDTAAAAAEAGAVVGGGGSEAGGRGRSLRFLAMAGWQAQNGSLRQDSWATGPKRALAPLCDFGRL
jgi:hypothetical protein